MINTIEQYQTLIESLQPLIDYATKIADANTSGSACSFIGFDEYGANFTYWDGCNCHGTTEYTVVRPEDFLDPLYFQKLEQQKRIEQQEKLEKEALEAQKKIKAKEKKELAEYERLKTKFETTQV